MHHSVCLEGVLVQDGPVAALQLEDVAAASTRAAVGAVVENGRGNSHRPRKRDAPELVRAPTKRTVKAVRVPGVPRKAIDGKRTVQARAVDGIVHAGLPSCNVESRRIKELQLVKIDGPESARVFDDRAQHILSARSVVERQNACSRRERG